MNHCVSRHHTLFSMSRGRQQPMLINSGLPRLTVSASSCFASCSTPDLLLLVSNSTSVLGSFLAPPPHVSSHAPSPPHPAQALTTCLFLAFLASSPPYVSSQTTRSFHLASFLQLPVCSIMLTHDNSIELYATLLSASTEWTPGFLLPNIECLILLCNIDSLTLERQKLARTLPLNIQKCNELFNCTSSFPNERTFSILYACNSF